MFLKSSCHKPDEHFRNSPPLDAGKRCFPGNGRIRWVYAVCTPQTKQAVNPCRSGTGTLHGKINWTLVHLTFHMESLSCISGHRGRTFTGQVVPSPGWLCVGDVLPRTESPIWHSHKCMQKSSWSYSGVKSYRDNLPLYQNVNTNTKCICKFLRVTYYHLLCFVCSCPSDKDRIGDWAQHSWKTLGLLLLAYCHNILKHCYWPSMCTPLGV